MKNRKKLWSVAYVYVEENEMCTGKKIDEKVNRPYT